jgi:hypothetical protein
MNRSTYEKYLTNIVNFLKSKDAQLFSSDHFIKTVFDAVCPALASNSDPKYATA